MLGSGLYLVRITTPRKKASSFYAIAKWLVLSGGNCLTFDYFQAR
jgi:hypothetical protein